MSNHSNSSRSSSSKNSNATSRSGGANSAYTSSLEDATCCVWLSPRSTVTYAATVKAVAVAEQRRRAPRGGVLWRDEQGDVLCDLFRIDPIEVVVDYPTFSLQAQAALRGSQVFEARKSSRAASGAKTQATISTCIRKDLIATNKHLKSSLSRLAKHKFPGMEHTIEDSQYRGPAHKCLEEEIIFGEGSRGPVEHPPESSELADFMSNLQRDCRLEQEEMDMVKLMLQWFTKDVGILRWNALRYCRYLVEKEGVGSKDDLILLIETKGSEYLVSAVEMRSVEVVKIMRALKNGNSGNETVGQQQVQPPEISATGRQYEFPDHKLVVIGIGIGLQSATAGLCFHSDPSIVQCPLIEFNECTVPAMMLRTSAGEWCFGNDALKALRNQDKENGASFLLFDGLMQSLWDQQSSGRRFEAMTIRARSAAADLPLLDVFTECLRIVKNHVLNRAKEQIGRAPDDKEVLWVLIMPYGMNDVAQQIIREAACRAGMTTEGTKSDPRALRFVSEPHGAMAGVCHEWVKREGKTAHEYRSLQPMSCHVSLRLSSDEVHASLHQVVSMSPLEFLSLGVASSSRGGGANAVSREFEDLMRDLVIQLNPSLWEEHLSGYVEKLCVDFRSLMHGARPDASEPERVSLRELLGSGDNLEAFGDIVDNFNRSTVEPRLKYVRRTGSLTLSHILLRSMFEPALREITRCLDEVLDNRALAVSSVIVSGDFSASAVVRHRLVQHCEGRGVTLLFPSALLLPSFASITGAVYMQVA